MRNPRKRTAFAVKQRIPAKRYRDLFSDPERKGVLRHGVDIEVTVNGQSIRFLSVHLKALCSEHPLIWEGRACKELASQVPILGGWIDEREGDDVPFVVMGDFNRRLNGRGDSFWSEIDDGEPAGANLVRATEGFGSKCWGGGRSGYVDHIVYGLEAKKWAVAGSFGQLVYEEPRRNEEAAIRPLSDFHEIGCAARGIASRMVGFVRQQEVSAYLLASDILVMPYSSGVTIRDGTEAGEFTSPRKLFEYMAAGKPIVATGVPSVLEILTPGEIQSLRLQMMRRNLLRLLVWCSAIPGFARGSRSVLARTRRSTRGRRGWRR